MCATRQHDCLDVIRGNYGDILALDGSIVLAACVVIRGELLGVGALRVAAAQRAPGGQISLQRCVEGFLASEGAALKLSTRVPGGG